MRNVGRCLFLMACLGVLASGVTAQGQTGPYLWFDNLETARQVAAETNRLLLIHFWAPWCRPCRQMESEVFNRPEVLSAMATNYVSVKVNFDQNQQLVRQLDIQSIPADVIVTPDGQVVQRFVGGASADRYTDRLNQVAYAYRQRQQTQLAMNGQPMSPPTGPNFGHSPVDAVTPPQGPGLVLLSDTPSGSGVSGGFGNPAANLSVPPTSSAGPYTPYGYGAPVVSRSTGLPSPQGYQPQQGYSPQQGYPPQQAGYPAEQNLAGNPAPANPYLPPTAQPGFSPQAAGPQQAQLAPQSALSAQPTLPTPPTGPNMNIASANMGGYSPPMTGYSPSQETPLQPPAEVIPGMAANVAPAIGSNYGGSQPMPAYGLPNTPMAPAAVGEPSAAAQGDALALGQSPTPGGRRSTTRPEIDIPPGNPPLALDGYCPVSLTEKHRWVLGNKRWGVRHEGRTYLFAGPEEQQKFLVDPDRYAPILAGCDVVQLVENSQVAEGRREYGAWFGGRVYLFGSEETFQRFSADPYRYIQMLPQVVARVMHESAPGGSSPEGLAQGLPGLPPSNPGIAPSSPEFAQPHQVAPAAPDQGLNLNPQQAPAESSAPQTTSAYWAPPSAINIPVPPTAAQQPGNTAQRSYGPMARRPAW